MYPAVMPGNCSTCLILHSKTRSIRFYYLINSLSSIPQTERRGSLKSFASNLLERTTSFKHNLGSSYPGGGSIAKRGHHQVSGKPPRASSSHL